MKKVINNNINILNISMWLISLYKNLSILWTWFQKLVILLFSIFYSLE